MYRSEEELNLLCKLKNDIDCVNSELLFNMQELSGRDSRGKHNPNYLCPSKKEKQQLYLKPQEFKWQVNF